MRKRSGKPAGQGREKQAGGRASQPRARAGSPGRGRSQAGRRFGRPGLPALFRKSFDEVWGRLFSSPVHLDSALSKAPDSVKKLLTLTVLLLQRPSSLAHFLKFRLFDHEPWGLSPEELADWPTARAMAQRLLQAYQRDAAFAEEGFAVESDYPPDMVEEWKRDFGRKTAEELVRSLAESAPLALRASRLNGDRDSILSALNDSGELELRGKISRVAPFGFVFPGYVPILRHPDFEKGLFEIQDEGSQLMALFALWPEEFLPMLRKVPGSCREWPKERVVPKASGNWVVVDTCAGAGGKTLALADAMLGRGQVFAYDVSVKKLEALRRRSRRAGLSNIKAVAVVEESENLVVEKFAGRADRVLVDAPCSGWGVLRRNPDLKWRQDGDTLTRLTALQARLLDAYAPLVKVGGYLTYGACTFRKKETTEQVQSFLERHPEFESVGGGFCGPGPSDGFFMYSFRRKNAPASRSKE